MAFTFKLETADGTPADPPTFQTVAPLWRPGDTIPLGGRALRVVDVLDGDSDEEPVLVVEDVFDERLTRPKASSRITVRTRRPALCGPARYRLFDALVVDADVPVRDRVVRHANMGGACAGIPGARDAGCVSGVVC